MDMSYSDINVADIASKTEGYVFRDLETLIDRAVHVAMMARTQQISCSYKLSFFVVVCMYLMSNPQLRWHRGAVGRVSDSRSRGCGFESRLGMRRKNSGHVSHTYVPLFTKQYKLVPAKGR